MYKQLAIFCSLSLSACGQMRQTAFFPVELEENSGLAITNSGAIWTHNDGGNAPCIYQVDTLGKVLKTICITNANNKDWEDISYDRGQDVLYIGDFGNNDNVRRDLQILKIANFALLAENPNYDSLEAELISFHYNEQKDFPPAKSEWNFDAEAFVYFNNALYIFTKCRTQPYTSYTHIYKIPAKAGNHTAMLADSFDTHQASWYQSVTGAGISPSGKQLALISGGKIWLFSQFSGDQFFKGKVKGILLPSFTQKEAIDFINEEELYISDERSFLGRARLYKVLLRKEQKNEEISDVVRKIQISPMPIAKDFDLSFKLLKSAKVVVHLYDEDKHFLQTLVAETQLESGLNEYSFNIKELEIERYTSYFVVIVADGKEEWHPIVVK